MTENEKLIERTVRDFAKLIVDATLCEGDRASLEHLEDALFLEVSRGLRDRGLGLESIADIFRTTKRTIQRRINRAEEHSTEQRQTLYRLICAFLAQQQTSTREEIFAAFPSMSPETGVALLRDLVRNEMIDSPKGTIHWIGELDFDGYVIEEADPFIDLAKFLLFRENVTSFDEVTDRFPVPDTIADQAREALTELGLLDDNGVRPKHVRLSQPNAVYDLLALVFSEYIETMRAVLNDGETGKAWFTGVYLPEGDKDHDVPFSIYEQALDSVKQSWADFDAPDTPKDEAESTHYGMGIYYYKRPVDT